MLFQFHLEETTVIAMVIRLSSKFSNYLELANKVHRVVSADLKKEDFDEEKALNIPEGSILDIICLGLSIKNLCSMSVLNELTVHLFMLKIMNTAEEYDILMLADL